VSALTFLSFSFPSGLFRLPSLNVLLHLEQRVQLEHFVQRVPVLQLVHGGVTSLDQRVASHLKVAKLSYVKLAPLLWVRVT